MLHSTSAAPDMPLRSKVPGAVWLIVAGSAGLLLALLVDWVATLYAGRPILGIVATVSLALLLIGAAVFIWREVMALRHLQEAVSLRAAIEAAVDPDTAARLLVPMARRLAPQRMSSPGVELWLSALAQYPGASAVREAFEHHVLSPLDAVVDAAIARHARQAGIVTMLSPSAVGDFVFFYVRAVVLLREIASIHGLRPGRFAELRLLRKAFQEAALVGGADLATDAVSNAVGQMSGLVLGTVAQGGLAMQRMVRIGLLTASLCRPIAAQPDGSARMVGILRMATAGATAEPERRA